MLPRILWLCACWPVWTVIREGQQSGKETYALSNVAPEPPTSSWVRGSASMSRTVWSSVTNRITFGFALAACDRSPLAIRVRVRAIASAARSAPALAARVRGSPCMSLFESNQPAHREVR